MQNTNNVSKDNLPRMTAGDVKTIFTCWSEELRRFLVFEGRTTRYEFWSFQTVSLFIFILLTVIGFMLDSYKTVYEVYGLYLIVPLASSSVRRLHDIGKSGLIVLPLFILGILVLLNLEFDLTNSILTIFLWLCYATFLSYILSWSGDPYDNVYGAKIHEATIYNQDSFYFIFFMFAFLAIVWIIFFINIF